MKRMLASIGFMLAVALGTAGCGEDGVTGDGDDGESTGEVEQAICAPTCSSTGTVWGACGPPTTRCPGGQQQEFYVCRDGSPGNTTCRTRCCLAEI